MYSMFSYKFLKVLYKLLPTLLDNSMGLRFFAKAQNDNG